MQSLKIALAAAIHDWGKFAQRTQLPEYKGNHAEVGAKLVDELKFLFPSDWLDDLRDAVGDHHGKRSKKRITQLVKLADCLSAREREERQIPKSDPAYTPLTSIFGEVDLGLPLPSESLGYSLNPLSLKEEVIFPQPKPEVDPKAYHNLWGKFKKEAQSLSRSGEIGTWVRLNSFLSLLEKYFTFIPSATPWEEDEEYRTFPDISLFDHLKTSAAIASCLARLWWLEEEYREQAERRPVACLLRGDLSGIQNFIYRVAKLREEATYRGIARRLRGRSFYISMLNTAVAEYLVRELELTTANILFEGGGHFDLLLPVDEKSKRRLEDALGKLEDWFLKKFEGELGLVTASQEIFLDDFGNLKEVYQRLEKQLVEKKRRKWLGRLRDEDFLFPQDERYHVCQACELTPLPESGICSLCREHEKLGEVIPHTHYLAFVYESRNARRETRALASLSFDHPLDVEVWLLNKAKEKWLAQLEVLEKVMLYRLNPSDESEGFIFEEAPRGIGLGFRFLAKEAPVAKEELKLLGRTEEVTKSGEGLDFEEISEISSGSKDLGVLKADVDHLGFVFSQGIPLTFSRRSTLSHFIEVFFCGWLDILCRREFEKWREGGAHPWKEKISGLFYVVYSGGDDLLLLGPWEECVELAQALNEDFFRYVCHNPNLTLSSGISVVGPHYPVQRFVGLAKGALDRAKEGGRNSIFLFDKSFRWRDGEVSFENFIQFTRRLKKGVEERRIPRGLLTDLGKLHQVYQEAKKGERKPLLSPLLHYAMVRRLKPELCEELMPDILRHIKGDAFKSLISYVLLATRKEGERCR